jgi:transposase
VVISSTFLRSSTFLPLIVSHLRIHYLEAYRRIHSRYTRQVADLPCAGRHITLLLTVRKFFCPNAACPRKIFAEQFPDLVPSYARLTIRLREALVALGLATSGEVVSRLAPRLGMQVAPTTLLRHLRAVPVALAEKVRVLGVDDFAWKKGQTYGTILVNLELRRPIDLLDVKRDYFMVY